MLTPQVPVAIIPLNLLVLYGDKREMFDIIGIMLESPTQTSHHTFWGPLQVFFMQESGNGKGLNALPSMTR